MKSAEPVDLGQQVCDLRKAKKWTLEQAAQQAGLTRSTLSKVEDSQMSPTYEMLKSWPLETVTYEHELLGDSHTQKRMLSYRARIRAQSVTEFDGYLRHDGEEFLFIVPSVIQLYTEFYEPIQLRCGDSAYYDASMGHNVVAQTNDDATLL